jgi:hypothetical protein
MPYVGKTPVVGNFVKLDTITTSATATYNLLNGGVAYFPQTANNCIVSLNGVIQSPTSAYTISGSTIVFSDALTSADSIDFILVLGDVLNIGTPSDGTITNAKLALTAGSAGTPTISTAADTNTGIFFPAADTIGFAEGGTEVMRIDSDGDVGIGTSSPSNILDVSRDTVGGTNIRVTNTNANTSYRASYQLKTGASANVWQMLARNGGFFIGVDGTADYLNIDSSGNVMAGGAGSTTDVISPNVVGIVLENTGSIQCSRSGVAALSVNRKASDGELQRFFQDGTQEGSISVSGTTVSYNGFTGSHWSRFIDDSKPDVLRGTVMESLDQMTDWYVVEFTDSENNTQKKPYALKANEQEGDVITYDWNTEKKDEEGNDIIEQIQATIVKEVDVKHMMSKISDTSEAKNVYGVFHAWDNDDLINNDFYVASVGSYVVRIKAGQTVSKGDLLQSNGDGTAKVQADDLVRASSFAKVLSNTVIETYEDGSFIVPCSLMC